MQVRNPRTGEYDYHLTVDRLEDIREKAIRLRAAQKQWNEAGLDHRISVISDWADRLEQNKESVINQLSIDTGRNKISKIEYEGTLGMIRGRCHTVKSMLPPHEPRPSFIDPNVHITQQYIPYPVVGVISPWNFPMLLALIDAIPALLAGSSVLLKASEVTPRFLDPIEQSIVVHSGLSDVIQIIRGGAEAGREVIEQSDAVCFTGSVATGQKIAAHCAQRFIPAFLELGGKDPAIVLEDADIEITSEAILRSAAGATGQACQSLERVYADEKIVEHLTQTLLEKISTLKYNFHQGGALGPLIYDKQASIIQSHIDDALSKGAIIHSGGKVENMNGGLWIMPTVITQVTHDMKVMTEETFGPIIPIMTYSDEKEAIRLANDSIFGLSASVFSQNIERAHHLAKQIDAGGISINDASLTNKIFDVEKNAFKYSGINGSRMGRDGFLRFFRKKALMNQTGRPDSILMQSEE